MPRNLTPHESHGEVLDMAGLREYLDEAITKWRVEVAGAEGEDLLIARCYVDAFQSVRTSVFGETLPPTSKETGHEH